MVDPHVVEAAARVALGSAYDLVISQADKITDITLRQSFLEKVEINRQIVREYEHLSHDA